MNSISSRTSLITRFLNNLGARSLRSRLILANILITTLALAALGYYNYFRTEQTQEYLSGQLDISVNSQAEETLKKTISDQSNSLNSFFTSISQDVVTLKKTTEALLVQKSAFSSGPYWDATQSLSKISNGNWDNPAEDVASIFMPADVELTTPLAEDLNTLRQLDFLTPSMLEKNSNIAAIYFGGKYKETIYYPNIDLASLVPPDFDITQRSWYLNASPENNPEKNIVWSDPYLDAAQNGLIVTVSTPVFNRNRQFRGVAAMDIQLNQITELVSEIHIGDTGYAFMIDKDKRLIAMPSIAYQNFGISPEAAPLGTSLEETEPYIDLPEDFRAILGKMSSGENGLETISFHEIEQFVIYQQIPETGYSLGIIVPTDELLRSAATARTQIEQETRNSIWIGAILVLAILLLSILAFFFIGNRLMLPLNRLSLVAEEIAAGNLDARAPVQNKDEIGSLAFTINRMTSQLQDTLRGLEQRVIDRTRDLEIVAEVGTIAATILDTNRLLQTVVNLTKERFNLYHSHIYLLNEKGESLVLAAGAGEPGRVMASEGLSIPLNREQSLVARAARERQGVTVNDVTQEPDYLPNPLLPDTRSELAVPMIVGGNVIGVFDIQSEQVGRFTDTDVNIQTTLASQLATSIQNVRSFERSQKDAELQSLVNVIGSRIQRATTIEDTLQTAIRELGSAIGASRVKAKVGQSNGSSNPTTASD